MIDHQLILMDISGFFNYSFIPVIVEACVVCGAMPRLPLHSLTDYKI